MDAATAERLDAPGMESLSFEGHVESTIEDAASWLGRRQADDGHWVFELEADVTIPAEYIMLNHFLDEINDVVEQKLARYIRATQEKHGGWALYHDGEFDISATVKAYYALKLVGDDIDAPHMKRAREGILARGGAAKANVFTRIGLALFGQVPWRAAPVLRPEVILLPKWAPFHMDKVSYWSRTVMVPLLVLTGLRPTAKNPRDVHIRELFDKDPWKERGYNSNPTGHWLGQILLGLDHVGRAAQHLIPPAMRRKAVEKSMAFVKERLNGEDGLGAIFPAMANTLMAFDVLGYEKTHPDRVIAREAVDKLLVFHDDWGYCQPCLSPVWDTGLAAHALMEARGEEAPEASAANDWLRGRQILDVRGDWIANRDHVRPGGWAFQYWNDYYPDVDDTAVVGMALHREDAEKHKDSIDRAAEWVIGMQSENGGWGAFDADNEYYFLEHIPFADHGALLDPPTLDVTARCVSFLAQIGYEEDHPAMARGLDYMRKEQEDDGSWFGRWGTNYIYGTWSALCAFNMVGENMEAPHIRKAVDWLKSRQREDGGWGEDCGTYWEEHKELCKTSTPSQTAWALLALMAAGEVDCDEVKKGVEYLMNAPREGGKWVEEYYNAVGFPKVFYLRYHGYSAFFPLWALARYRNLKGGNNAFPMYGM